MHTELRAVTRARPFVGAVLAGVLGPPARSRLPRRRPSPADQGRVRPSVVSVAPQHRAPNCRARAVHAVPQVYLPQ